VLEVDWVFVAAIVAATCAVIAAAVCVGVWRRVRSLDVVGQQIIDGDAAVKRHAEESLEEIRERVGEMGNALARIETRQAEDEKHVLRAKDLGAIHEKINRLAEDLAATRAQSITQSQMIGEQLRVLQRLMQDNLAGHRRSR